MYEKTRPLPGQFDHCEICSVRFTVTPYSKEGPDGGLLCPKCSKELAKELKNDKKAAPKKLGRKRRQNESDRLDGVAPNKAKSLQQLCIEKVVDCYHYIDTLGDVPPHVMDRLNAIFSKKRILNSKTLKLFTRPDVERIALHDAACKLISSFHPSIHTHRSTDLEVDDYMQMFATGTKLKKVVITNACQFKDGPLDYMLDKCPNVEFLQLNAANLVTDDMWRKTFSRYGQQLQAIKLTWLDASFTDDIVEHMVSSCPNLTRVKFKLCRKLTQTSLESLSKLTNLEHLSLQLNAPVTSDALCELITRVGAGLRTLSLQGFEDLDDAVLNVIKTHCNRLNKLRLTDTSDITDAGLYNLFTEWQNPPLSFIDLNSTRDVDNNNPNGPQDDPIGLGSTAFPALLSHSASRLAHLDVSSCRHISLKTFHDVFNGIEQYPSLRDINASFCSIIDTRVVAGIFKSCPAIQKVIAFGCFDVLDVIVPGGVVLIGVPRAQDAIEQVGTAGMDVVAQMVDVAA